MYDQNLACNECSYWHYLKHTLNAVIEFTELVWIHNTHQSGTSALYHYKSADAFVMKPVPVFERWCSSLVFVSIRVEYL